MRYIYGLVEQGTKELRYVGQTKNPQARLRGHLKSNRISYRNSWIKSQLRLGKIPQMTILEECGDADANIREIFWIKYFRKAGNHLVNLNDGGQGGVNPSIATRMKMRIAKLGKPGASTGTSRTEEQKKQMSESRIGKSLGPCSEIRKLKISRKQKGIVETPEAIAINSRCHQGLTHSEQTKERMRVSAFKRWSKIKERCANGQTDARGRIILQPSS